MTPELDNSRTRVEELFAAIERRVIVRAGETDDGISQAIFELAFQMFGTRRHWHRRMIRSGPNTRLPFSADVPDRTIETDDIVSLDLGVVFGEWEADFGRTYVIGRDPAKLRLRDDLSVLFHACQEHFARHPQITGAQLFEHVLRACAERGYGFGGAHAGHLIGHFPFERSERDAARNRIRPDNQVPMREPYPDGAPRTWILEVHLLDPTGAFGGFYEDILNA